MENKSDLLIRLLKEGKITSEELLVLAMEEQPNRIEYVPYIPAPIEPYFPYYPYPTYPPFFTTPFPNYYTTVVTN